jgi:hypothetical protein
MTYAHTRHLLAQAAALVLALPLAATAQAQVMAQSKATVTGLKITLIDLNTNDGIAPSLNLSTAGSFGGVADNQRALSPYTSFIVPKVFDASYTSPQDSVTPLLSLQSQLNGGKVTVPTLPTGTTMTLGSTLSASSSANLNRASSLTEDLSYSTTDWRYDPSTGNYIMGTESFTGQRTTRSVSADSVISLMGQSVEEGVILPSLTVSANTLVVIEGTSTLSSTIDAKRVLELQAQDPALKGTLAGGANAQLLIGLGYEAYSFAGDPNNSGFSSSGGSSIHNQQLGLGYDMYGIYANTGTDAEEALQLENLNLPASGLLTLQQSGQFRVALANASSASAEMWLGMNLGTVSEHIDMALSAPGAVFTPGAPVVPEVPTVPSIPEPGTWAQMGLGLIGLVAAVRRRRVQA